jgi:hypothetical protein
LIDALTTKTAALEDLRSEKRILNAEREEALRRLLSIQSDLEDIAVMEEKIVLGTEKIEKDLKRRRENDEYLRTRRKSTHIPSLTLERITEILREHNLPALTPLARNPDEENAQYLQARLNARKQEILHSNGP